jgi:hypothetical protein
MITILFYVYHRWHHLLKGDFLEGKRNWRLDHLLHTLTQKAILHFIACHRQQAFGFEGPDLALKKRIEVEQHAKLIKKLDVAPLDNKANIFLVKSQSDGAIDYEVDLENYNCTCLSFPIIWYCKDICAVQIHYSETINLVPLLAWTLLQHRKRQTVKPPLRCLMLKPLPMTRKNL